MAKQILKVLSVNRSEKKGTVKQSLEKIVLDEKGVQGDAHAGLWHRQVSLLAQESIEKFSEEAGRKIKYGEFAENITTEGALLYKLNPMDILANDTVELMVTQIGKKCHGDNCNIFKEVGNCVMPKEGIFAKVLNGGELEAGAQLEVKHKILNCKIIVLSDRASSGEYLDKSGALLKKLTETYFSSINYPNKVTVDIIPDVASLLQKAVSNAVEEGCDVVFTSGGTGIGPRDITPEVVNPMLDKEIPGIMDAIRLKFGTSIPNALLSRSSAGVVKETLVFTLPGSPKAVKEYFEEIEKVLYHLFLMLHGIGH